MWKKKKYMKYFTANDGKSYALRLGKPKDAKKISPIYYENYGPDYIHSWVYRPKLLKKKLRKSKYFWLVGVQVETREIFGVGLIERRGDAAYAGKMVFKKKYHGKGLARRLGSEGITHCLTLPEFKGVLKLYSEVRTVEINAQKMIEETKSIPYAFLPLFINFGDRREFDFSKGKPYTDGYEESAIFYSTILPQLWKKRDPEVFLLDNEEVIHFYEYIKNYNKKLKRMMKKDKVILLNSTKITNSKSVNPPIKDIDIGFVSVEGILEEKEIRNLLNDYSDWRIINVKIPICKESIKSVETCLENGFTIVGYDVGSYRNEKGLLYDSILLCAFPNGVDFTSFANMNIIEETKPLVDKVIEKIFIRSFKKFMNFDNQITLKSMDGFSEYLLDIYKFKHSSDIHNLICSLEAFIDIYHVREEKILRVLNRLLKHLLKYHKRNLGKSINLLLQERLYDFIKGLDVEVLT